MKYKVGDKVRIVKNVWGYASRKPIGIGDICVITECNEEYGYPYSLDKHTHLLWCDEELELMEDNNMFTKADLKDGMIVEYADGGRRLVINNDLIGDSSHCSLENFDYDLTHPFMDELDINKVYRYKARNGFDCLLADWNLELIWERHTAKEMTVAEIEKALGYSVKIIKE